MNFGIHFFREVEKTLGTAFMRVDFLSFDARNAICYAALKWGLYKGNGKEPKADFTLLEVGDWIGIELHDESLSSQVIAMLNEEMPKGKKEKNVEAGGSPAI